MADQNARPRLHVEFYLDPVENKNKSKLAGRPIYEDKEFVRIRIPGDRNRTLVAPANQQSIRDPQSENNGWLTYAQRFPEHYSAFKAGIQYVGNGTPLRELPFLTESQRAELRALNVLDGETLAALEGEPLKRLGMGGRELKNQATAWLAKAAGSADVTRQAAENAALQAQIAELQRQMAEFTAGRPAVAVPANASQFASWADADIKTFIAEKTGTRPKGNPSHATLVSTADELAAQASAAA